MTRNCKRCGQQFTPTSSRNLYCRECRTLICIRCGQPFTTRIGNGHRTCSTCRGTTRRAPILTCGYCGRTFRQRGGHPTKCCGNECRYASLRKPSDSPNHRTWQYKHWRRQVFKRDNYTCQHCGATTNLQSHHIKPMCEYPILAYMPSNGLTLCTDCHAIAHGSKPMNHKGTDRLACSICGDAITGSGKSSYCRSCSMIMYHQRRRLQQAQE